MHETKPHLRLSIETDNLHFVSGTKFSGATQVCHHEAAVRCSQQEEGENKNPGIVISKQITGNNFLSETNNNFIGGQSSALGDDYGRFKREKLTDKTGNRSEEKLLQDERRANKTKSKNKKANKKPVFKHFKKKFSIAPPDVDDNVVKSKEVVKFLKLEHNDDVNNCSQSRLCKSRKKEIKENITLSPNKSNKNKKTGHHLAATVQGENAPHHKKSEKDIKVAAKLSLIKKEITTPATPPSEAKMDEDETKEMSDNLNVKPPPEVVLIPQSLDDDTNIKSREDTVIQNPIKSDSEILQNKSQTELKADIPISTARPSTTASPHQKNLSFRTKPLNKLPFSRVVAAQKKRRPGEFSPYIPFPDLLSNLTQTARSVRQDPIKC